jgi:hypothetical protein
MQALKKQVFYQLEIYKQLELEGKRKPPITLDFEQRLQKIKQLMIEVKLKIDGQDYSLWSLDHHLQKE